MSRKRYCKECGNVCEEERCPICGRRTHVYTGSYQENDDFVDVSKYQLPMEDVAKEEDVLQETPRSQEHDRREHRFHHVNCKNLRLHMEKGSHPYYEHVRIKKNSPNMIKWIRFVVVVMVLAFFLPLMVNMFVFDEDENNVYNEQDTYDYVTGNIDMEEVYDTVDISCTLEEYDAQEDVQKVTLENDSPYLVKADIPRDDNIDFYVSLPAYSTIEELLYESHLDSCKAEVYGAYEMDIEQPQVSYEVRKIVEDEYFYRYALILKESIEEDELETLLRYLYAEYASEFSYEPDLLAIYEGDRHLYDAYIDYEEGIIQIESVDGYDELYDIYIEN